MEHVKYKYHKWSPFITTTKINIYVVVDNQEFPSGFGNSCKKDPEVWLMCQFVWFPTSSLCGVSFGVSLPLVFLLFCTSTSSCKHTSICTITGQKQKKQASGDSSAEKVWSGRWWRDDMDRNMSGEKHSDVLCSWQTIPIPHWPLISCNNCHWGTTSSNLVLFTCQIDWKSWHAQWLAHNV